MNGTFEIVIFGPESEFLLYGNDGLEKLAVWLHNHRL